MQNCLVELLSVDMSVTYQLGFVYIRQLAIHLRTATTSGKKEAQQVSMCVRRCTLVIILVLSLQSVYNWQFVHCLDLWGRVLGHMPHPKLCPLIYPLVQVVLGTVSLQPSPRYYPLRLHLTNTLLDITIATDTFIPTAPLLLEVFC